MGELTVRDTQLAPALQLPPHVHSHAYACIVLDGDYLERGQNAVHCRPGMVLAHPAGQLHSNEIGARGARCINVELEGSLAEVCNAGSLFARSRVMPLSATHHALAQLRNALQHTDTAAPLGVFAAVMEVLCAVSRQSSGAARAPWLRRVIDALEANLTHTPTAAELARVANVHASHLARTFKRHTGETISAYLRRRRLEQAAPEVRLGERSIAEIAAAAGFFDQAHFTRAYRAQFGVTPAAQRRAFLS